MNANRNTQIQGNDAEEWKPEWWLSPLLNSVERAQLPGVYSSMWVRSLFYWANYLQSFCLFRMSFIAGSHSCMSVDCSILSLTTVNQITYSGFKIAEMEMSSYKRACFVDHRSNNSPSRVGFICTSRVFFLFRWNSRNLLVHERDLFTGCEESEGYVTMSSIDRVLIKCLSGRSSCMLSSKHVLDSWLTHNHNIALSLSM